MELHAELLEPLLYGLPAPDKADMIRRIERARDEQIQRKLNPPRRRRRGADGLLHEPVDIG